MKHIAIAILLLTPLMPFTAYASLEGTPHDYRGTIYGRCGICHVPHAGAGRRRLWRVSPTASGSGSGWDNSGVGSLCASCHNGGATTAVQNTGGTLPHNVGVTVYAASSHGRDTVELVGALSGIRPVGEPYISGLLECTSCHNVHFEGTISSNPERRPFLRTTAATVSEFCARCHPDRLNDALTGGGSGLLNTTGNHPVDIAYNGNLSSNGSKPIYLLPAPAGALTVTVSLGSWSLGGKFQDSAGHAKASAPVSIDDQIGCQTCHAVHNPAPGPDQAKHLLAINEGDTLIAALCEGCHGNPSGNTPRGNSGATMEIGASAGDHPIDCQAATPGPVIDRWYITNSTTRAERTDNADKNWPSPVSGSGRHIIICTSCHSAHRARVAGSTGGSSTNGGKLTRTGSSDTGYWCGSCHGDPAPVGHHSNKANWSQSLLTCDSCHGSTTVSDITGAAGGNIAHNGFEFGSGFSGGILTNNASQVCNACHFVGISGGVRASALGLSGTDPVPVTELPTSHLTGTPSPNLTSHYIGKFANVPGYVNVKRGDWANHTLGEYSAFSKYGGGVNTMGRSPDLTGDEIVCESCHSLLRNAAARKPGATSADGYKCNLLLQDYEDDSKEQANPGSDPAAKTVGCGLCVACHNQVADNSGGFGTGNGPVTDSMAVDRNITLAGTHPMTGWSISRAQDSGRSKRYLVTDTADGTYADAAGAPKLGSYPAQDKMDCDSCHRPHMAPENGTYDQTQAGTANKNLTGDDASRTVILESQQAANEWSVMCQQCHNM